jgi:thymidylate synthase (FAD)
MASNAQFEIRSYANTIGNEITSKWCPIAWEAFTDYRLNAINLTRIDSEVIRAINSGGVDSALQVARKLGLIPMLGEEIKKNRERDELEDKLEFLGIQIPWGSL